VRGHGSRRFICDGACQGTRGGQQRCCNRGPAGAPLRVEWAPAGVHEAADAKARRRGRLLPRLRARAWPRMSPPPARARTRRRARGAPRQAVRGGRGATLAWPCSAWLCPAWLCPACSSCACACSSCACACACLCFLPPWPSCASPPAPSCAWPWPWSWSWPWPWPCLWPSAAPRPWPWPLVVPTRACSAAWSTPSAAHCSQSSSACAPARLPVRRRPRQRLRRAGHRNILAVPSLTRARPAGGARLVVGSRGARGGDRPAVLALDVQVRHQPARLRRAARQHAVPRPAGTPGQRRVRRAQSARARWTRGPHLRPEDCRDVHPRLLARQDLRRRRRPAPLSPRAARTERAPSPRRPLARLVWHWVGRRMAGWAGLRCSTALAGAGAGVGHLGERVKRRHDGGQAVELALGEHVRLVQQDKVCAPAARARRNTLDLSRQACSRGCCEHCAQALTEAATCYTPKCKAQWARTRSARQAGRRRGAGCRPRRGRAGRPARRARRSL